MRRAVAPPTARSAPRWKSEPPRFLSKPLYADFGPTLAAEYLQQRHGIHVGRETLRGWMAAAGLWKPRRRKPGRAHLWRPRRRCRGELVQWDTSEHDWLEGRGEKLYLIGMIDDASSELLARFVRHDSSAENRRLLKTYLEKNGRPAAFYTDRASLFVNTPKNSAGEDPKTLPPTQIGRALEELGIESIRAYSPQAKGRVERSFGTAQDRLVKGLRVAGASTIKQANAYLESEFLPWWNATLRVQPAHPDEAHRELGPEHDLDSALSHVETRRVANDYTIRFPGKALSNRPQGDCARPAGREGAAGEPAGRQPRGALRQARAGVEALSHGPPVRGLQKAGRCHCGREGSSSSSSPQGQRLDGGFRSEKEPAAVAGGASFRRPPGRCASRVAELGVAANPRLHWERRANGARRSSRCRSPRPQLRDFTKAIPATNARPAEAEAGPRPPARQGGAAESTNTKPSDGNARGSCRSAACFGASPVASASGSQDRRDPAPDSHHSTTAPPAGRPQPDISAWQRIGHFYLALTDSSAGRVPPPGICYHSRNAQQSGRSSSEKGRALFPGLGHRPASHTTPDWLEELDRADWSRRRAGGLKHRRRRMAVRTYCDCPLRRPVDVAGHLEHRLSSLLQLGHYALHALHRRARDGWVSSHLAWSHVLGCFLFNGGHGRYLALSGVKRGRAPGGGDPGPASRA